MNLEKYLKTNEDKMFTINIKLNKEELDWLIFRLKNIKGSISQNILKKLQK